MKRRNRGPQPSRSHAPEPRVQPGQGSRGWLAGARCAAWVSLPWIAPISAALPVSEDAGRYVKCKSLVAPLLSLPGRLALLGKSGEALFGVCGLKEAKDAAALQAE